MYDDAGYADSRLRNTVVRLKDGTPITITSTNGGRKSNIEFNYQELGSSEEGTVKIKDLNLEPVPLGFCNVPRKGITYVARMPMQRDWRQGMRSSNTRSIYGFDHREVPNNSMHNTIVGHFPTFKTAYHKAMKGGIPTAFHRHFAVCANEDDLEKPFLLYKWHGKVGNIVNGIVSLDKKWIHLTNPVEELTA